jgi:hypothetical protein
MPELTRRYIVMTMSAEGPFDVEDREAPFVLKPWKDPAALEALEAYRAHCYPELAEELGQWIEVIRQGPALRGGVGSRNEQHLSTRGRRRPAAPRRQPRPSRKAPRAAPKAARRKTRKRKSKGLV